MKKRRHLDTDIFPDLESLIDVIVILFIVFGIPYLIGFYTNKFLFSGTLEENRMYGAAVMFGLPLVTRILKGLFEFISTMISKLF